jgi:hypothetical protein
LQDWRPAQAALVAASGDISSIDTAAELTPASALAPAACRGLASDRPAVTPFDIASTEEIARSLQAIEPTGLLLKVSRGEPGCAFRLAELVQGRPARRRGPL